MEAGILFLVSIDGNPSRSATVDRCALCACSWVVDVSRSPGNPPSRRTAVPLWPPGKSGVTSRQSEIVLQSLLRHIVDLPVWFKGHIICTRVHDALEVVLKADLLRVCHAAGLPGISYQRETRRKSAPPSLPPILPSPLYRVLFGADWDAFTLSILPRPHFKRSHIDGSMNLFHRLNDPFWK